MIDNIIHVLYTLIVFLIALVILIPIIIGLCVKAVFDLIFGAILRKNKEDYDKLEE
jgi:hypothetical protein